MINALDMNHLISVLHSGNHALAVRTAKGCTLTFDGRGVSDLLRLLDAEPQTLRGAAVADKVVGKAAATLIILGGIKAVYADTVSEPALQLFASAAPGIEVTYHNKVEYIINRTKTGWCPMELACKDAKTPAKCLEKIKAKLAELKAMNRYKQ